MDDVAKIMQENIILREQLENYKKRSAAWKNRTKFYKHSASIWRDVATSSMKFISDTCEESAGKLQAKAG